MSTGTLNNIQVLRALAASMVVVGHSWHDASSIAVSTGAPIPASGTVNWGAGVDLFFVISGFIMLHTTERRFGAPGAATSFLRRRFIRVVPLYWLMTTALLVGSLILPRLLNVPIDDWQSVIKSYLFVPDLRANGEVRPILALGWTLNFEMFFYSIFALAMLLPLRRGLCLVTAGAVAFVVLGQLTALPSIPVRFWSDPIVLEFFLGVGIGLVHRAGIRLGGAGAALVAAAGVVLFALCSEPRTGPSLSALVQTGLPAAMIVAAAALGPQLRSGSGVQGLVTLGLVRMGDASYSLYLSHPFVLRPLRDAWIAGASSRLPLGFYVLACVVSAFAAALACFRWIEQPIARRLGTPSSRTPKPADTRFDTELPGTPTRAERAA